LYVNIYLLGAEKLSFTAKQKKIIDAAIELIAEKSIQQLTIKNLSKKLGVTEGALYRHFPGKLDILLGILMMFKNEARKNLDRAKVSKQPAIKQLESIFMYRLKYFTQKPAVAAVIFSESIFQNHKRLAEEVNNFLKMHEETLHVILEKGIQNNEIKKDIDIEDTIYIIIGSMRYLVTRWRLDGHQFDLCKAGKKLLKNLKLFLVA